VSNFLLFSLSSFKLVGIKLSFSFHELREVTSPVGKLFALKMDHFITDHIQEISSVRHDDNGSVDETGNVILKPDEGRQVQMVSGLIKHKNFRVAEQHLGNSDTHSPTTGESSALLIKIFFLETNTRENFHSFALCFISLDELKSLSDIINLLSFSSLLFL
jgi:hypothetical protein